MSRSNRPNINAADSITRAQLKFLSDLAQSGKLSRTAEHLGLSLSAASRMLDRLREAFGDPLFTPHARGLTPTDAMLRLEPELRRTIEQTDRLFSQPSFDPATLRRTFSIAARGLVVPELLAYAISRVAREAPSVHLEMHHRTSRIWDQIEAGELDSYPTARCRLRSERCRSFRLKSAYSCERTIRLFANSAGARRPCRRCCATSASR